jgi:hypothetical protein
LYLGIETNADPQHCSYVKLVRSDEKLIFILAQVEEYNGKRDLGDLKSFVEKHMTSAAGGDDQEVKKEAKDEL